MDKGTYIFKRTKNVHTLEVYCFEAFILTVKPSNKDKLFGKLQHLYKQFKKQMVQSNK